METRTYPHKPQSLRDAEAAEAAAASALEAARSAREILERKIGTGAALVVALRNAGARPYSYSGRCMYGTYCVAVTVADVGAALQLGLNLAEHWDNVPDVGRPAQDAMGREIVLYWPSVTAPDDLSTMADEDA